MVDAPQQSRGTQTLPERATVNSDGSVTLRLSAPVSWPSGRGKVSSQTPISEVTFRRLTGADVRRVTETTDGRRVMAKSLGISIAQLMAVVSNIADADLSAMRDVCRCLTCAGSELPSYAVPLDGGGFRLPLLYPVSDGQDTYAELHLRPLPDALLPSIPQDNRSVLFMLSYAAGIPLRQAISVADAMDAADFNAVRGTLRTLLMHGIESQGNKSS